MEPGNETKKVLLVEDDESIREMYATAFKNEGLEVITANDGAEGLEVALKEKPSVILFDINMPVLDGHKAAKRIRLDSWGEDVPIIFLTNHSDPTNVTEAHSLKPDDYIVKVNTSIKEVVNKVRTAMYKRGY